MTTATKLIDKRKPFRRVDNQAFLPSKVLDGDGAACGCSLLRDLGDDAAIDAKLDAFLKDSRNAVVGKIVGTVIDVVKLLLDPRKLAKLAVDFIREKAGDVLATLADPLISALGVVAAGLLLPITAFINPVISAIEEGIHIFLRIFATPVMLRAVRALPQWVPVTPGQSNVAVDRSQVIEMEGVCTRSYGNPIDSPLAQWHTWFAWNVQVKPEPEYAKALSPAGDPPNTSGAKSGETSVIRPGSFEIQWDAGAMLADRSAYQGGFASTRMPANDGPMVIPGATGQAIEIGNELDTPVVWPMPGMFVWACGRHVYDCSRVTHKAGAKPSDDDVEADKPLMSAMIQPARALATARFQAFQFRENGTFFTPAIEFMFIACKRGGYIDHSDLADEDYVFIIDLPPGPPKASPYPIAHTDNVPHNTITLRPRLLKELRFIKAIGSAEFDPVLELVPPSSPGDTPQQVKLTITKAALAGVAAYGFKLALGWHDPGRDLARQVLLCELDMKSLQMRMTDREKPAQKIRDLGKEHEKQIRDLIMKEIAKAAVVDLPIVGEVNLLEKVPGVRDLVESTIAKALQMTIDLLIDLLPSEREEEWLFRIGVNGVWVGFFFQPRTSGNSAAANPPHVFRANELVFKFALAKGDELMFGAHGAEFDPVGDIMHSAIKDRTLKLASGAAAPWTRIVKPASDEERDELLFAYMRRLMFDTTEGVSKLALGFDNAPLGLIDADPAGNRGPSQQHNPMVAQETFDPPLKAQRLGHFARAIPSEMILVEDLRDDPRLGFPRRADYDLRYELKVKPQIDDGTPADA